MIQVIILDNGIVQLTFSNPGGDLIGIRYNNITNLLENSNKYGNRGYWDIEWGEDIAGSSASNYDRLVGTKFEIITANNDQIEISFTKKWNDSSKVFPVNMDKRYIMLRNYSGFYTYGILEHPRDAPAVQISVIRAAFKLKQNKFNYMAVSDDRQRIMPSALDRRNGEELAYPEAVLLTNPSNPNLKGEVDDKYQYSSDHKDIKVHGWISSYPSVGFWVITPSQEFLTTGPTKQELTSHVGPTSLSRGSVKGQLFVQDRYLNKNNTSAKFAYIGLAAPGKAGSWQWENKGYQFWTQADAEGVFLIKNVRSGNYNLYAWVPGVIGDYMYNNTIAIQAGNTIDLNNLVYIPPRNGPTVWEIGIPDRTASEFYVPDPLPNLTNRLFINESENRFRQYGLWDRYTDLYPKEDLIYTIGVSDYRRDWFFAHVNRKLQNGTYQHTTWQVKFKLEDVILSRNYTLQLALASASLSALQVHLNNHNNQGPLFSTHLLGRDNSIARHGIHGSYWIFSVSVSGSWLRQGQNTLYLTQSRSVGPFGGLLYDYVRFEAPSQN
ncbi:hypothetical protein CsatB_024000 [Cannabis sativa]